MNLTIFFAKESNSFLEFILIVFGFGIVVVSIITLLGSAQDKSKEIVQKVKEKKHEKKREKELENNINERINEYQLKRNSFKYFSDKKLLQMYIDINSQKINVSNIEVLALEEELVKRELIPYSKMHEKLYEFNKK